MDKITTHKDHYNLYEMYATVPDGTPELVILQAWYDGEYGEDTCIKKLKAIGAIKHDTFISYEFRPWLTKKQMKGDRSWQKR